MANEGSRTPTIVALLVAGGVVLAWFRAAPPAGLATQYGDAIGCSIAASGVVLMGAITGPGFRFGDYAADRGQIGMALDVCLEIAAGLVLSGAVAWILVGREIGGLGGLVAVGVAAYLAGVGAFTARNIHYYRPISDGVFPE